MVHVGNAGGSDQVVAGDGRGEWVKGSGVELTGLAGGLDVGTRERGATLGLAASLLIP